MNYTKRTLYFNSTLEKLELLLEKGVKELNKDETRELDNLLMQLLRIIRLGRKLEKKGMELLQGELKNEGMRMLKEEIQGLEKLLDELKRLGIDEKKGVV